MHEVIRKVLEIMMDKQISIRDTLFPFVDILDIPGFPKTTFNRRINIDNVHNNGHTLRYSDPFKVKIIFENANSSSGGKAATESYSLPNFNSLAFNFGDIKIKSIYDEYSHVVAHELVHLFQHSTPAEDGPNYISFTGNNTPQYLGQRLELEAHYIQCIYMWNYEQAFIAEWAKIFPHLESDLRQQTPNLINQPYNRPIASQLVCLYFNKNLIGPDCFKPNNQGINNRASVEIGFNMLEYCDLRSLSPWLP